MVSRQRMAGRKATFSIALDAPFQTGYFGGMPSSKPKVLLVDDDEDFLALLALHLAPRCKLTIARDGEEAWLRICRERPDLVLLDVMMPKLSGWEVCRAIKSDAVYEDIPVIFVTAVGARISGELNPFTQADDILLKPFDLNDLDRKMSRFLSPPKA